MSIPGQASAVTTRNVPAGWVAPAYSNFITPVAAMALVLGANLGSAINPVFEGGRRSDPASYRLPAGNLLNRLVGVVLLTPLLPVVAARFSAFQPDMAKMTAEFHIRSSTQPARRLLRKSPRVIRSRWPYQSRQCPDRGSSRTNGAR